MALSTYSFPINRFRTRYDYIGGVRTGPFNDGFYLSSRTWKQVNRFETPNFGKLKASGAWLPENPYSLEREIQVCPTTGGSWHLKKTAIATGNYSTYWGPLAETWNTATYLEPSIAEYNAAAAEMSARLLSKVKSMKVNVGNFIAERDQMFNMFSKNARKIVKAVRYVKRGNFKKAFEALGCLPSKSLSTRKSVANNWLELQYGWLPLLSDIFEAAQEVERTFEEDQKEGHINSRTTNMRLTRKDRQNLMAPLGAYCNREYIFLYRGKVNYTVDYQGIQNLGRIGLTNPISVAWEVLPFSFVVDWALPVGRALENLDATIACTFKSGATGAKLFSHLAYVLDSDYLSGGFRWQYVNVRARGRWFEYRRSVLSGFPKVGVPQPKNPFSALHAMNALALLTQAFR
jgi:hypothetical protein